MPYIKKEDRTDNAELHPQNPGQLNYAITLLVQRYFKHQGGRYQHERTHDGEYDDLKDQGPAHDDHNTPMILLVKR